MINLTDVVLFISFGILFCMVMHLILIISEIELHPLKWLKMKKSKLQYKKIKKQCEEDINEYIKSKEYKGFTVEEDRDRGSPNDSRY